MLIVIERGKMSRKNKKKRLEKWLSEYANSVILEVKETFRYYTIIGETKKPRGDKQTYGLFNPVYEDLSSSTDSCDDFYGHIYFPLPWGNYLVVNVQS